MGRMLAPVVGKSTLEGMNFISMDLAVYAKSLQITLVVQIKQSGLCVYVSASAQWRLNYVTIDHNIWDAGTYIDTI